MPLGSEVDLGPRHIVLDGDPAPPKTGTAPNFRPMSVVAIRLPISVTAEHVFLDIVQSSFSVISPNKWWLCFDSTMGEEAKTLTVPEDMI